MCLLAFGGAGCRGLPAAQVEMCQARREHRPDLAPCPSIGPVGADTRQFAMSIIDEDEQSRLDALRQNSYVHYQRVC